MLLQVFQFCARTATVLLYMYVAAFFKLTVHETTQARQCMQFRMPTTAVQVLMFMQ